MRKSLKVATLLVGQGFNALVNFLFLPYLARALDYEAYGFGPTSPEYPSAVEVMQRINPPGSMERFLELYREILASDEDELDDDAE